MPRKPPSQRPERQPDPDPDFPPGPLHQAIASSGLRNEIQDAHIVFGIDIKDSRNRSLFFGKASLERIVKTGNTKAMKVANVPIDFDTDDAAVLAAACLALKGSCCLGADSGETEMIDPSFN